MNSGKPLPISPVICVPSSRVTSVPGTAALVPDEQAFIVAWVWTPEEAEVGLG